MDLCNSRMEQQIIKDLLSKYGLEPYDNIVDAYLKLIQLGFNAMWLRNMCIIKEFDTLYKTDLPTMTIYTDLSLQFNTSEKNIQKILSNRREYEI